jgi:hypothetical protein
VSIACSTYYARLPAPGPAARPGTSPPRPLTPQLAARLAGDPNHQVRRQVAEHPQLPPPVRDLLADDPSANVRLGVFGRQDTPEPLRRRIYATIQRRDRALDLLDDDLDDDALLQQVEDYMAVAELRSLRLDWVTADPLPYASSPYICFRRSAARSRSLPADAVMRLLHDDDSGVRTTMATHAPPDLLDPATAERIDREFKPDKKMNWRPADAFVFPPQTLRRFATDPDPRMRRLAPRDPNLPTEVAERLATDADSTVRRAVAGHPALPAAARRTRLADPDEWVAHEAAAAPTLPVPRWTGSSLWPASDQQIANRRIEPRKTSHPRVVPKAPHPRCQAHTPAALRADRLPQNLTASQGPQGAGARSCRIADDSVVVTPNHDSHEIGRSTAAPTARGRHDVRRRGRG